MKIFSKLIFWLVVPTVVIAVLAAVLGFNSSGEMIKALVEQIIPFGNVVSSIISTQALVSVGQPVTFGMVCMDIIKTLMASFLFTFVMRFVNIVMGITSKSVVSYFFAECVVAVLLAILCGFLLDKLHTVLSAAIGQFLSISVQTLALAVLVFLWFRLMLKFGAAVTVVVNFLLLRKLIPSVIRMLFTYLCAATILVIMTSDQLSASILPLVIAAYGLAMIVSSLFENSSIIKDN